MRKRKLKVATIDLYNGEVNEGMRCIRELVTDCGEKYSSIFDLQYDVFETRNKNEVPVVADYDIFVSSGGPGSPFDGVGTEWENKYFNFLDEIWSNNQNSDKKKYIFFICHSFQMMARYFSFAEVGERYKKSFGVHPFTRTEEGESDELMKNLSNPFYAADFRQYQVINPNEARLAELGAKIVAKEIDKGDGHQPAIMAVRITDEIAGTQFHPEADPDSMIFHLRQGERKEYVIKEFGEEMYFQMLASLEDPNRIPLTRKMVIPTFLNNAVEAIALQAS